LLPFGSVWISVIAFGLVCCNAVTLLTDLICALFGLYAAMFVNRIYPGKLLKTSFVSPGKPLNLVFASPGKSWKTVFYCLYEPSFKEYMHQHTHTHTRAHTTILRLPKRNSVIGNHSVQLMSAFHNHREGKVLRGIMGLDQNYNTQEKVSIAEYVQPDSVLSYGSFR